MAAKTVYLLTSQHVTCYLQFVSQPAYFVRMHALPGGQALMLILCTLECFEDFRGLGTCSLLSIRCLLHLIPGVQVYARVYQTCCMCTRRLKLFQWLANEKTSMLFVAQPLEQPSALLPHSPTYTPTDPLCASHFDQTPPGIPIYLILHPPSIGY